MYTLSFQILNDTTSICLIICFFRNSQATASQLLKQLDDMEEVEPVTDVEIHSQQRSTKTGRCRPVKQIIMNKDLQELVDKMSISDHFEEHVVIDYGWYFIYLIPVLV